MTRLILAGLIAGWSSAAAAAPESFCPGGANPNPDVLFCDNFETGDLSLWPPPSGGNLRATTERPFMGNNSLKFIYGELGAPSFFSKSITGAEELWLRYYWYFDDLYHWGYNQTDHVLSPLVATGGVTCSGSMAGLDWGPMGPKIYRSGNCNGVRFGDLSANRGTNEQRLVRNGRWYRVELHVKLNTIGGCVDRNANGVIDSNGECDGVVELWLDDALILGYYDLNFRQNDNPGLRLSSFVFNHYYRTSGQTFNGRPFSEFRDNLVVKKGTTRIGAAAGEPTNRGTPDLLSPYKTEVYKEWFAVNAAGQTVRPGSDCANRVSLNGYSGTTAFVDSPVHNGTASPCAGQIARDQALSARTTSGNTFSGGSLDLHNGSTLGPNVGLPGTQALNGWFYLDPTSFPASRGAALGGIIYYANTGRNYIAFGVDANNHPVLLKQFSNGSGAAPVTLGTNLTRTVSVGAWQHFELRASQQGGIWSLWLNGSEVLKVSGVNDAALWSQGVLLRSFFGISDHLQNPNALTVYYDDISIGTNSFEDCFGWNSTICPFTPSAGNTLPPANPKNMRVQ